MRLPCQGWLADWGNLPCRNVRQAPIVSGNWVDCAMTREPKSYADNANRSVKAIAKADGCNGDGLSAETQMVEAAALCGLHPGRGIAITMGAVATMPFVVYRIRRCGLWLDGRRSRDEFDAVPGSFYELGQTASQQRPLGSKFGRGLGGLLDDTRVELLRRECVWISKGHRQGHQLQWLWLECQNSTVDAKAISCNGYGLSAKTQLSKL